MDLPVDGHPEASVAQAEGGRVPDARAGGAVDRAARAAAGGQPQATALERRDRRTVDRPGPADAIGQQQAAAEQRSRLPGGRLGLRHQLAGGDPLTVRCSSRKVASRPVAAS